MIYNAYQEKDKMTLVHTVDGKLRKESVLFKPSLFFKSKQGEFKTIYGEPLKRKFYSNVWVYYSDLNRLKEQNDNNYFGDIDPKYQYITNRFLNKKITIDDEIKVFNYDIEAFRLNTDEFMKPELGKGPVQSITIQEMHSNKYYIFAYKDYEITDIERKDSNGELMYSIKKEQIIYVQCKTEVQLLKKFVNFLRQKNVQVITGFNILKYDNMYIVNRLKRLGIEEDFVNSAVDKKDGVHFGNMQNLDYQVLYKKFSMGEMSSYSLDNISKTELGFGKLEMADGFRGTYQNDFKKFIDYNCIDVMLPYLLEKKLQYIRLIFTMSNRFRCLPIDVLSVTQYWDTYLYKYCLEQGIVIPRAKRSHKIQYMGGYVKEPIKGLTGWQVLYDIESSYPTNNRKHNISTETLVDYKDFPQELFDLVLSKLFSTFKKVWDINKNKYATKSGKPRILGFGVKPKENQFHVMYLRTKEDRDLIMKVPFPRFFVIEHKEKIDVSKNKYCKQLTKTQYVFFAMSKFKLIDLLDNEFKGYSSVKFVNHALINRTLVDEFVEDYTLFEKYTKLIKEHNLIITPILQFYKKTKKLGILARTQEVVFFDRKKAKKSAGYDSVISTIAKEFKNNNMKVNKERFYELGINTVSKQLKSELISLLKTRDEKKISDFIKYYSDLAIVDEIINQALKIAINGAYGATANENFRWSDVRLSESTTSCGQLVSRGLARYIEQKNVAVWNYQDTDSVLFNITTNKLNDFAQVDVSKLSTDAQYKWLVSYLEKNVEPLFNEYYDKITDLMNSRDVTIKMEREVVIRQAIFTAKKKYHWRLYEKDGVVYKDKYKSKTRGLDTRRSSTPKWVSNKLEKFLEYAVTGASQDKLRKYVLYSKKLFFKLSMKEIGKPTSTGKLKEYTSITQSHIPPHYKGAIVYNKYLEKYDKSKEFEQITVGNKVKWVTISDDNEWGVNVISFPENYDERILNYVKIDYDKQFESVFMSMVNQIFNSMGWDFNKKNRIF
jgi:DNA polymerase elongation subunit (family B)